MKRIQGWEPRNKDAGFLLPPKFWCFQKHAFLHIFYLIFLRKKYRFVTLYSLIFFNVQGGACQFLIDNDKVDHYI